MHIPDGYLSPATCMVFGAVMIPIWAAASKTVKKTLSVRQVPYLAIGAAFSFVIMMFNLPIPGGSSGHAVGGVLVAILIGPWAACIAITVALVIQALLFGDGGIITIGANCFNIAFVLPGRLNPAYNWSRRRGLRGHLCGSSLCRYRIRAPTSALSYGKWSGVVLPLWSQCCRARNAFCSSSFHRMGGSDCHRIGCKIFTEAGCCFF